MMMTCKGKLLKISIELSKRLFKQKHQLLVHDEPQGTSGNIVDFAMEQVSPPECSHRLRMKHTLFPEIQHQGEREGVHQVALLRIFEVDQVLHRSDQPNISE